MNRVPDSELVLIPGGTLITATPEEGRALAITLARHMIHNIQPDLDILKAGRPMYASNPDSRRGSSAAIGRGGLGGCGIRDHSARHIMIGASAAIARPGTTPFK